jgi:hypothetical protein
MNKQELIQSAQTNGQLSKMQKTDFLQFTAKYGYCEDSRRYYCKIRFFLLGELSYWKKTNRVTFRSIDE